MGAHCPWEAQATHTKDTGTPMAGKNGITEAGVAGAQPWELRTGTQNAKVSGRTHALRAVPGGRTAMLTNLCLFPFPVTFCLSHRLSPPAQTGSGCEEQPGSPAAA